VALKKQKIFLPFIKLSSLVVPTLPSSRSVHLKKTTSGMMALIFESAFQNSNPPLLHFLEGEQNSESCLSMKLRLAPINFFPKNVNYNFCFPSADIDKLAACTISLGSGVF